MWHLHRILVNSLTAAVENGMKMDYYIEYSCWLILSLCSWVGFAPQIPCHLPMHSWEKLLNLTRQWRSGVMEGKYSLLLWDSKSNFKGEFNIVIELMLKCGLSLECHFRNIVQLFLALGNSSFNLHFNFISNSAYFRIQYEHVMLWNCPCNYSTTKSLREISRWLV